MPPPKDREVKVGNKDGLDINVLVDVTESELAVAVASDMIERGTSMFFSFSYGRHEMIVILLMRSMRVFQRAFCSEGEALRAGCAARFAPRS